MLNTISLDEVLRTIETSKLQPFAIGFCVPKTGEMIDLKEALAWKYVKGKFEYQLQNDRAVSISEKPSTPNNKYLRLIVDINSGKIYNVFIDLIDRFNDKEVFF